MLPLVIIMAFRVGGIGLEPTTFAMSTRCSNQLSYPPARLKLYHSGNNPQTGYSSRLSDKVVWTGWI